MELTNFATLFQEFRKRGFSGISTADILSVIEYTLEGSLTFEKFTFRYAFLGYDRDLVEER